MNKKILFYFFLINDCEISLLKNILEMTEGGGDSSTAMVDVLDLAKNAISISGLKDAQVCHESYILTQINPF